MSSRTTTSGDSTKPPEADPSKAPKLDSNLIISSFADGSNPWEAGIQLSRDFDDDMCEMLRDELENLLLFAALFSAIVTSFATLSYQWLQPNNSNNPPPVSYNLAVQINFLWFLSLAASLSVSSIGILCMQWVRQYKRWKTKADKRTAALRRQRFEGFLRWHVPDIVAALPVILQIALVLFAIGVNSLLWSLHHIVALGFAVVSVPALVFIIATTLAPVMQWLLRLPVMGREQSRWWWSYQCPYQTPQAWLSYVVAWLLSFKRRTIDGNWAEFDKTWLLAAAGAARDDPHKTSDYENKLLVEELVWLDHEYADDVKSIKARAQALRQLPFEDAKEVVMRLFHTLTVPDADAHLKAVRGLCVKDDVTKERSFKELKVWYLWGHAQTHPSLDAAYMEARIDFMSEIPTLKIDLPGPPRADHLDVQCLVKVDFLVPRFLHCLKVMISKKRLRKETSKEMWFIVGDLLEYSIRHAYTDYLSALGSLFKALLEELGGSSPTLTVDNTNAAATSSSQADHQPSRSSAPIQFPRHIPSTASLQLEPNWQLSPIETIQDMLNGLHFFFALHADQKIGRLAEGDAVHMRPLVELIKFLYDEYKDALALIRGPPRTRSGTSPPLADATIGQQVQSVTHQPATPEPQGDTSPEPKPSRWGKVPDLIHSRTRNREALLETFQLVTELMQKAENENWETLVRVLTKWAKPKEIAALEGRTVGAGEN